jgi:hypothetical protein
MNLVKRIKICSLGIMLCALPLAASAQHDIELEAGSACSDFGLGIDFTSGSNQQFREFKDANGNVVRTLSTGTGNALLFTNLDTGKSYSTKSNGANTQTRYNVDGSSIVTASGHNLLIMFPTDIPPGPSTRIIVGRLVYSVNTDGVFSIQTITGKTSDICELLSY